MKIAITGTPGTGKTTLAKNLGKKLGLVVLNEKDFALQNKLGKFNDANELEIPIKEFTKKANAFLAKTNGVILEGHVICEAKLNVDFIIVVTIDPEELEQRLEQRNYPVEKLMDNVFCEGIQYCKKHVERLYPKQKILQVQSKGTPAHTLAQTLHELAAKISPKAKKK